jgi:hypothetical protein
VALALLETLLKAALAVGVAVQDLQLLVLLALLVVLAVGVAEVVVAVEQL